LNNHELDYLCYEILAKIIKEFSNIQNEDGALLDTFISQFNGALAKVAEGKVEFKN